MDVDLSRLPAGTAAWTALVDHALALGDLSEVNWLEIKSELPFLARVDRKRSAVVLSRAILGMSNRMPDSAARHLGGFGVILIGMRDRNVVGAERVDGAVLHDALQPYLGEGGPKWDYHFIDHPGGLVLALVVDPPSWGDAIHACRKSYSAEDGGLAVRDGDVFVRVPGITRPATSNDIAELERRRLRSPEPQAIINLGVDRGFDRVNLGSVLQLVADVIDRRASELLSGLPKPQRAASFGIQFPSLSTGMDHRTPSEFRTSVQDWKEKAESQTPEAAFEFLRDELARSRWTIRNESDSYLESVRVQVNIPPDLIVLMASDTTYCRHGASFQFSQVLPAPPAKWYNLVGQSLLTSPRAALPRMPSSEFDVDVNDAGSTVTWHVGDLRPRSFERSGEFFALVTDSHETNFVLEWQATARGIDHVFKGELLVPSAQGYSHVSWKTAENDGTESDG